MLSLCDEPCKIFDRGCVFVVEAETLCFEAGFVNQYPCVGLETCKCDHQMVINSLDLSDCARILKFSNSILLNTEYNAVFADNCNGCTASIDSFEGILHLKELTIWSENSDSFVVGRHDLFFL